MMWFSKSWNIWKNTKNSKIVQKNKFISRMDKLKGLSLLGPFFVAKAWFYGKKGGERVFPENDKKLDIVDKVDKNTQYCVNFTFFTWVFLVINYNIYDGLGWDKYMEG